MTGLALDEGLLLEDHHVHSTFSDGQSTIDENIAEAERLGLQRLGCVDHVRRDTTYLPEYVAAIRSLRLCTRVEMTAGIEAKILDGDGQLDMPSSGLDGIDRVLVADHQFPWHGGPQSPRTVKGWLDSGDVTPSECVSALVESLVAAIRCNRAIPLTLAHLFSILPKVGLSEDHVPEALLEALADATASTGTVVEISERWRCPSIRTLRWLRAAGATLVCSTDSHRASHIGRYAYVRATMDGLNG